MLVMVVVFADCFKSAAGMDRVIFVVKSFNDSLFFGDAGEVGSSS